MKDILRLLFLLALLATHAFWPTPAEADFCMGCIGCGAHDSNYACCAPQWPHAWTWCQGGTGGCMLGQYCGDWG